MPNTYGAAALSRRECQLNERPIPLPQMVLAISEEAGVAQPLVTERVLWLESRKRPPRRSRAHNTYLNRASLELMRQLFSWATDFVEIAKIISLDTGARLSLCRQNNGPDGSAIFSERAVRLIAGQMQVKSSSSDRELEQTTD